MCSDKVENYTCFRDVAVVTELLLKHFAPIVRPWNTGCSFLQTHLRRLSFPFPLWKHFLLMLILHSLGPKSSDKVVVAAVMFPVPTGCELIPSSSDFYCFLAAV